MKWTDELIRDIEQELRTVPHGEKSAVVKKHCERLGVDRSTLYRHVDITGGRQRAPRDPEIPAWKIDKIAQVKAEPAMYGVQARELATEDAIDVLVQLGILEEGDISISTANRRLDERGWNQPRSYTRHEDDFVNQVHMMDFSRSEYFDAYDINDDGEYVLRVDGRKGQWNYKNKPEEKKKKLWVVSYLDTYSRAWLVRYYVSTGENLSMATDFLRFAWQRQDSEHPLRHLPIDCIKLDQGAVGKSGAFVRGMEQRLGVRVERGASKSDKLAAHQSGGKVERRFRTLWQRMELKRALILKKRGVETITLPQLNAIAHNFCTKRLERQHPVQKGSIKQIYETGLRLHEQRTLAEDVDLFTLFYAEDTRRVSATNDITIDNQLYKVPEGYAMQEIYYITTPDGRIKGMSPDKRDTFELMPFDAATATGEKMHEPSYKELMAKRGLEIDANRINLTEGDDEDEEALPDNVHTLGAREEKEETPETPFNPQPRQDVFEDWDLAKAYVCESFGCRWQDLTDRTQGLFRDLFEMKKLDKQAVEELSQTAS